MGKNHLGFAKFKHILGAVIKIGVILAFFFVLIIGIKRNVKNYITVNQYIDSDVVYANGDVLHIEGKDFGMVGKGDMITMHLRLPKDPLIQNGTLVFYDFNTVTEVWCDGVLLDSYGAEIAEKGFMIGNHDFFIDVPDSAWGGEITLILYPTENNAFSNFTNVKIYPAASAYRYYIDTDPVGFMVALTLLVIGMVGVLACVFVGLRNAATKNGLYLALFALLVSLWMISNKGIYNLFGSTSYFWQPLEYMTGCTIAIPLLLFYRNTAEKSSRWRRIFGIVAIASMVSFALTTILNFTNILHYDALMAIPYGLLLISGILILIYTFKIKTNRTHNKNVASQWNSLFYSVLSL